jgi:hypothetical protein
MQEEYAIAQAQTTGPQVDNEVHQNPREVGSNWK